MTMHSQNHITLLQMLVILCMNIFDASIFAADHCQTDHHQSDRMATSLTNFQHYRAESNDCFTSPAIADGWTKSVNADGICGMETFNATCKEVNPLPANVENMVSSE